MTFVIVFVLAFIVVVLVIVFTTRQESRLEARVYCVVCKHTTRGIGRTLQEARSEAVHIHNLAKNCKHPNFTMVGSRRI